MLLESSQNEQFKVLVAGNVTATPLAPEGHNQDIIEASAYDDILAIIETTHFSLIFLDWSTDYSTLLTYIRDPLCINNKTPVIAAVDSIEEKKPSEIEPDAWLIKPIPDHQLNATISDWHTKITAQSYIQSLLDKTKNNRGLTLTLFEKLFEEVADQINQIEDALKNGKLDLAREITHKLHGSVCFCGLTSLQHSANQLENSLLNHAGSSINQHFKTLQQAALQFIGCRNTIISILKQSS